MYVIVTYDVDVKRVGKVCKHMKKYLFWSQNSVFEGEISIGKFKQCMSELSKIVSEASDSIYVYQIKNPKNIEKKVYGVEKRLDDMFL